VCASAEVSCNSIARSAAAFAFGNNPAGSGVEQRYQYVALRQAGVGGGIMRIDGDGLLEIIARGFQILASAFVPEKPALEIKFIASGFSVGLFDIAVLSDR
jgi:hypothetical protein